ncbi:MAG: hypothetical protein M1308_17090 [Actinobacteria bacterium]|nr:hypothetical protein [Actinomycetota bacterium]MCL5072585.1 hypothetical protein [Actinomycetota bacterium]
MDLYKELIKNINFKNEDLLIALIGTERFFAHNYEIKVFDFISDIKQMMNAEKFTFEKFKDILFIPGVWPNFGAAIILPSTLGSRIAWYENSSPCVSEAVIKNINDVKNLKLPDCKKEGFGPWYFNALRRFIEEGSFTNNLNFSWSIGPGELAGYLIGIDNLLINMYSEPKIIKNLLLFCTEFIISFLDKQFEINSFAGGFLLTDDISGLISKNFYEDFLLPCHIKIRKNFKDKIFVFHNDTKSDHIVENLLNVEMNIFNFGPDTSVELLIEKMLITKKVALMGNIDPTGILLSKDKVLIRNIVKELIKKASTYPGFIISAGGGLNATDPENINILIEEVSGKGK